LIHVAYGTTCQVTFYENAGFQGASFTMSPGTVRDNLNDYGWNDRISSIRFTGGDNGQICYVHACFNTYCSNQGNGGSTDYIQDQAILSNNDQISNVRVFGLANTTSWVFLKKDCEYSGLGWVVQPADINLNENIFGDTLTYNLGNDALSRVVTHLAAVVLYQDDYHKGAYLNLYNGGDSGCLNTLGFNDKTSSILYYDLSGGKGFPKPVGSWVRVASSLFNEPASIEMHKGYSTTATTSTETTLAYEMSTSITAGTEFSGVTVSASFSSSISTLVSHDLTQQKDTTCLGICSANNGICTSGSHFLWYWNIEFTRPWESTWSTSLDSCNWVCTCTATSPACPLGACADDSVQCNVCKPNWQA